MKTIEKLEKSELGFIDITDQMEQIKGGKLQAKWNAICNESCTNNAGCKGGGLTKKVPSFSYLSAESFLSASS